MVEVIKHKATLFLVFCAICVLCAGEAGAQLRPRISGLEGDAEYMGLLRDEHALLQRVDSLADIIERLRVEFRENPDERARYSDMILHTEEEIFGIRNRTGILARRIGEIEEAFIIGNLNAGIAPDTAVVTAGGRADLVRNDPFGESLPPGDYAALLKSQSEEGNVRELAAEYMGNYEAMAELAALYAAADNARLADSLYAMYSIMADENAALSESIGSRWSYIFDNKTFAYSYILQMRNMTVVESRLDDAARASRERMARRRGTSQSEEVASYFEQKRLLFEYEKALAAALKLAEAADSLAVAEKKFDALVREIPAIGVEEKFFLDFQNISAHNPSKYNARNPIPEAEVHPRGTIYRVLLNTYAAKQPVTAFKGLYPVGYLQQSDGKYAYYAGGYADWDAAATAVGEMKKIGFRSAKAVVWNNGTPLVLDEKPTANGNGDIVTFRIEIGGSSLSAPMQAAVRQIPEDKDVSRAESGISVGPFNTAVSAETAAASLRKADKSVVVTVVPNNP